MLPRILVVEDDDYMADLVCRALTKQHSETVRVRSAQEARASLETPFQLIILDVGLPDMSGIDLCREIRETIGLKSAILILTSRDTELDKVLGLESGADDYVTKPFSMPELMARVRSMLRRVSASAPSDEKILEISGITLNTATREVSTKGKSLELTAKEFDLLSYLAHHPGVVYSRQDLLNIVWGNHRRRDEHAVSCHINRLRAKIENDPSHPEVIQTVWGVGYRLNRACTQ